MFNRPEVLLDLLHFCEYVALFTAILFFIKVRNSFWKWFVVYLVYIILIENFNKVICNILNQETQFYVSYLSVPVEFIFFIWLYAYKTLENKKLFISALVVYLLSFIPDLSIEKGTYFFDSFNYMIGALILFVLVALAFLKQIKNESILLFKEDKMFYINIGVVLFYIGNLPFFGLYYLILKEPQIWNSYYIYFMISNCIMYLLFAASFIWGKPKL